jgi:hypothetical protein
MTPFGTLLYYYRSTNKGEHICALDILERDVFELSRDFLTCFNQEFTDSQWLDDLIALKSFEHAKKAVGALDPGQVYKLDQNLKDIVTIYKRHDALSLYREQWEAIQAVSTFDFPSPGILSDALPESYRAEFHALAALIDNATECAVSGFYLRAHLCRYHLLALMPDNRCRLLFWTTHPIDMKSEPPYMCGGRYQQYLSM